MAEAGVQFLLENLSFLIQGEIGLIMGVDKEMNKLSSQLKTIQTVLNDAEEKQFEDESVRDWLFKLNDVVYEIEDILDECATEVSKANFKTNYNPARYFKNILYRAKIGRRMKEVTEKIDQTVAQQQFRLNLREVIVEEQSSKISSTRETCSVLNESHPVYGRDEDKDKIVDILVNQMRDHKELSILPIIGMGGLGKTTLAQLVFNDQRVADHFAIKLWVCVSDDFDCKNLIKAILKSTSGNGSSDLDSLHLEGLQRRLSELLSNKRYLLILDDVWNEEQGKWDDELKSSLSCGSSGASVIVTTRLQIVAEIMSTLAAHQLKQLSEEECWLLFKQRAFKQDEKEHPNLEAIGKEIVKKCGGVPLAAKSLGGLLRFKRSEKEWVNVKESEVWKLPQKVNSIMPALKLSYKHLPSTLKQCFAFCSIFPKDTCMQKEEVILMWIAHGYISSSGTMEVEDIGDDIWNELALRGLFQDIKTNRYLDIDDITFKMHDLVHDLAQSIMENKAVGTQVEINIRSAPNTKVRQVTLKDYRVAFPTNILPNMDITSALMRFSHLRILNASLTNIKVLPSAIGKQKHLRSLDLSSTKIHSLPDAICSLWNLKILNLNYCFELVSLPKKMKEMCNLRHLFLETCYSLSEMPPSMGELSSLQTLSLFIVGHKKTNQLKELEGMNLGGLIEIKHLERVKSPEDAMKANLYKKQNLWRLSLQWEVNDNNAGGNDSDEKVFEALEPHPNLKRLWVEGFKGSNFPVWMGTLQNIVKIDIRNCPNCLHLPQGLGELPHLEEMVLDNLPLLQYIIQKDDTAGGQVNTVQKLIFPNLQKLYIIYCMEFVELSNTLSLPDSLQYLTSLKFLILIELPLFTSLPDSLQHLTSLESLELHELPFFTSLPDSLQHLTSLTYLYLNKLPLLTSLPDWLGNITFLQRLTISYCPNISSLPDTLQGMVNLKSLLIRECPELKRRCEKEKGEDWHKIAHIPDLRIY